jgi:hypothetical protein
MISNNPNTKYLLISEGGFPTIINGDEELIRYFNNPAREETDKYYIIGDEVEVKTSIQVIKKGVTYRSRDYGGGSITTPAIPYTIINRSD